MASAGLEDEEEPALPRLLVVDDDEADFAYVEALLHESESPRYQIEWAQDWDAGLAAFTADRHDLYLVDHDLGARTGIELLEAATPAGCTGALILLTGNRDPRLDGRALDAGATDFLVKDELTAEALDRSLRYALERTRLVRALRDQASQLAGGVAHDFNNMLMGVVGALDLASLDETCSPSVAKLLGQARASAERAAELSARLLAYARRGTIGAGSVDVCALVRELEPSLAARLQGLGSLSIDLPDAEFFVALGGGELEEILVNLVENASHSLDRGGSVRITAGRGHPADPPGSSSRWSGVRVTVADDGAGMPPDVAARAFEPFFTTRSGRGGTGLGLAMVHDIVTRRGGRARLDSTPGCGTRVELDLPRGKAGAGTQLPREAPRLDSPERFGLVLVVDDEKPIRDVLSAALTHSGATVLTADSAEQALELVEAGGRRPDLLISDVTMPGMSGFELQAALRSDGQPLPTLFVTGYGTDALQERGLDPETERLLDKPFRLQEMFVQLHSLLGESWPS